MIGEFTYLRESNPLRGSICITHTLHDVVLKFLLQMLVLSHMINLTCTCIEKYRNFVVEGLIVLQEIEDLKI